MDEKNENSNNNVSSNWTDTRLTDAIEPKKETITISKDFLESSAPAMINFDLQTPEAALKPRRNTKPRDNGSIKRNPKQSRSSVNAQSSYPSPEAVQNNYNSFQSRSQRGQDRASETISLKILEEKDLNELREMSNSLALQNTDELSKQELIFKIIEKQTENGGNIFISGFLEIVNDGTHGILRTSGVRPSDNDVYISSSQIKKLALRVGDEVLGQARAAKEGERYLSLLKVEAVNGQDPEKLAKRVIFEKLTPIYPDKQIKLETSKDLLSSRIIDLLSPIGFGTRGMIVAPPKSGKTILMKEIALGIRKNNPEIHLMIVLIGERPEEVTDIQRTVPGAEVVASNFDESPESQTRTAEVSVERAKRLVEEGKNVVILMDSLTRLARAYNVSVQPSGRTLSGGMDPAAIYPAKKFFGAARNFENGGSLTIIATALVETGSRLDEVVFEEFKGTGNMELKLDRDLANSKVFPAIDVVNSGTRNDELLLGKEVLSQSWKIRRMLSITKDEYPTQRLIESLRKTNTNTDFLRSLDA